MVECKKVFGVSYFFEEMLRRLKFEVSSPFLPKFPLGLMKKIFFFQKAQPKEVMLPLQLNKTRAAAARNLYGLAPEQLLAYASFIPRLPAYGPPPAPPSHHHHNHAMTAALTAAAAAGIYGHHHHHPQHGNGGVSCADLPQGVDLLRIGPAATGIQFHGNGFAHQQQHHPQQQVTSHFALGGSGGNNNTGNRGGQLGGNNAGGGPINPRDLAAAQLVAQQQAVYEAAMVGENFLNLDRFWKMI